MKAPYQISWQMPALCLLVLADIIWRVWTWSHPHAVCASPGSIRGRPFMLMADHRSNVDAISVRKNSTWESVWAEWDFDQDGNPDTTSYFFEGRNVFNVNQKEGQPPRFDVYMYGPGKSVTWWLDRGNGTGFTDRILYDINGNFARHDVLMDETWRPVESRGRERGVTVNGKWVRLDLGADAGPDLPATPAPRK